jgi:plasmid stabilization system protein ParE
MTSLRFHPAADEELLEATEWYLERSVVAAAGFIREVEAALARISEAPERYPFIRPGRRRVVLPSYPHDVVYRVLGGEIELIEIVAISPHARRPAYWRNR